MTRKRFTKLCMAKGWSRNKATSLARVMHTDVSYENAMHLVDFMHFIMDAGCILAETVTTFSSDASDVLREALKGSGGGDEA